MDAVFTVFPSDFAPYRDAGKSAACKANASTAARGTIFMR
jgi:hypothetical protein